MNRILTGSCGTMFRTLKKKINSSYWLKSGSHTFLTKLSESGFGLLTFLILVRLLPKEQFGVWILLISVSAITESMRKAFVSNPLIRFINISDKAKHNEITTSSVVQNIIYTIITSGIMVALAAPLSLLWEAPSFENTLYAFAVCNIFVGFFAQCNFIQLANLNYHGTFYVSLMRKGIFFLFSFYCLFYWNDINVTQLVIAQIVIFIFIIPFNLRFTSKYRFKFQWTISQFKSTLNFGKYTIGTNLSSMAFGNIDSWLLGSLMSVQEVALYNPAIRILAIVEIPIVSLSVISYPQLAKRIKNGDMIAAKRLYEKSLGAILAFILPSSVILILFSEKIILFLAGPEYLESSTILQITILFGLIIPFNRQLGITLNAMGKPQINMIFVVINLLINIICNYLFIKEFGLMGAAYGTLVAYILSLVYGQTLGYYLFGTSTVSVFIFMFKFLLNPLRILSK